MVNMVIFKTAFHQHVTINIGSLLLVMLAFSLKYSN